MEKRSTTTYTPAKKRMGCNAPAAVEVLDLIRIEFLYFSRGLGSNETQIGKRFNNSIFNNVGLHF